MGIHDQRFKALLQEYLPDFLHLFFPEQAADLDFEGLEWLQQEILTDPPAGDVYLLDLVARVHSRQPGDPSTLAAALVLLEVESREAVTETRAWLYHYYEALRRRHESRCAASRRSSASTTSTWGCRPWRPRAIWRRRVGSGWRWRR
ncbi:MAG: hypothetical protein L0Z62_00415 [Gemmataceae bacterium]|nr:hypothetical protein [Gemmataceae bacterium]